MPDPLRIHGFETSNNIKVRLALGYKQLPFEFCTVDPADRSRIQALSGQHLTPVLEHGGVVLFDSAAILRYLDANFRDTPRLFGESRDEQWAIEDLEFFARTRLAGPMLDVVHTKVSTGEVPEDLRADCSERFATACTQLADLLRGRTWLHGTRLSAADISAAAVLFRVRSGGLFDSNPGMEACREWEDRVMSYDPGPDARP